MDKDYYDSIFLSVINTLKVETDYEGKPDLSDAVYSGNLMSKWPFEIPYEDGVIKAERSIVSDEATAFFTYDDPIREGIVYTIYLADCVLYYANSDLEELDKYYFGDDPIFKDTTYEDTTIAGYRAASNSKYGAGAYGTSHDVIIDLGSGDEEIGWKLQFRTSSMLDNDKADAAKEAGLTDFSWLTDEFTTGADDYTRAKADEVLAAVIEAMEDVTW